MPPIPGLAFGQAQPIATERLVLSPLDVSDAEEMVDVLADEGLYLFIGGAPPGVDELRERFRRLVAGPLCAAELWLNWTVRVADTWAAIGYVQATVVCEEAPLAEVAWVIGVPWQLNGFAREAAAAAVRWLRRGGVERISANIHPDHRASAGVARACGLEPTNELVDGEVVWRPR